MFGSVKSIFSQTFDQWNKHDAQTLGAALSYYTVLSLAPLLVIAIAIAGLVFQKQTIQNKIIEQVTVMMGSGGADAFKAMISSAQSPKAGIIASVIGVIVLLFGASGVFSELRTALNRIWDIQEPDNSGIGGMVKKKLASFAMVVGIGFLLLVSLIATTVITGFARFFANYVPPALVQTANSVISIIGITILFAIVFRYVPEQTLPWRRLWPGAFATAILFTVGRYLLGLYLGKASPGSAYGAAGSVIVLFVWVYYSSQLFLFGAEFTRVFACRQEGVCLNIPGENPPEASPAGD